MPQTPFKAGDRVVHQAKPEWGVGEITRADHASHEGKPCQRLTVRFDRVGPKTITTAIAGIAPAPPVQPTDAAPLDPAEFRQRLVSLPDACTDPFADLARRIEATAALYRFSDPGRDLLAWATAMTAVMDALALATRHELESAFRDFTMVRDNHLRKLAADASRQNKTKAAAMVEALPAQAREVLRRGNVLR